MNFGMEEVMLVALAGAFIGLLIGFLTGRRMAPGSQQTRELEQRLEEAAAARERYEQRVNEHFAETASRMDRLTSDYRDVYQHMADGAAALCTADGGPAFTALSAPAATGQEAIEPESIMVEPPRDYAPKSSPDDPGVLNERFGLDGKPPPEHKPGEPA